MTMKTWQLKTFEYSESSSKREVYSNTILLQETRKTSNRQPNFTPKTTGKRTTTTKTKISIRKEIMKVWAEINKKEMKETIAKINKTRCQFFEKIKFTDLCPDSSRTKREESNQQNYKWKRRDYHRQCRSTKDYKSIMSNYGNKNA